MGLVAGLLINDFIREHLILFQTKFAAWIRRFDILQ